MAIHTYEIGGVSVRMTAAQAWAWNNGEATAESLAGATCFIPSRIGCASRVIDGEVVVADGLPSGESVDLWSAIDANGKPTAFYCEYMEGMPANRID